MRRGDQDQEVEGGSRADSLRVSMEKRERKKWGQGAGGGLGRGQRQLGTPSPNPEEASVGSPKAASEVLPLLSPRLPPHLHKLALGKRCEKMPNVKK